MDSFRRRKLLDAYSAVCVAVNQCSLIVDEEYEYLASFMNGDKISEKHFKSECFGYLLSVAKMRLEEALDCIAPVVTDYLQDAKDFLPAPMADDFMKCNGRVVWEKKEKPFDKKPI